MRDEAVCLVSDEPLDLDRHRGMAAQKATDIRRVLVEAEKNAKDLRDRQGELEDQLLSAPAASWLEARRLVMARRKTPISSCGQSANGL